MGVAQAAEVPIDLILEEHLWRTILVEFIHKTLRRKTFPFHEVAIGVSHRTLRQAAQAGVIVKDRHERWLACTNALSTLGQRNARAAS